MRQTRKEVYDARISENVPIVPRAMCKYAAFPIPFRAVVCVRMHGVGSSHCASQCNFLSIGASGR